MALLDEIQAIPSFKDLADSGAVVARIKNLENKATKVDALQQANDAYKAQIAQLQAKEIDTFLNQAVADGKLTSEQLPSMKKLMQSDRASAEELINSMKAHKPTPRAVEFIDHDGKGNGGFENKSWDELDRSNQLASLKSQNPALFAAKFKEKFGTEYKD